MVFRAMTNMVIYSLTFSVVMNYDGMTIHIITGCLSGTPASSYW